MGSYIIAYRARNGGGKVKFVRMPKAPEVTPLVGLAHARDSVQSRFGTPMSVQYGTEILWEHPAHARRSRYLPHVAERRREEQERRRAGARQRKPMKTVSWEEAVAAVAKRRHEEVKR